jgi:hypothetical protein
MEQEQQPWHLDKRVPLALILTLAGQTLGMVWWAAELSASVKDHEYRIVRMEHGDAASAIEARRMAEMLARLDERLQAQNAILRRIEESLARSPHQRPNP